MHRNRSVLPLRSSLFISCCIAAAVAGCAGKQACPPATADTAASPEEKDANVAEKKTSGETQDATELLAFTKSLVDYGRSQGSAAALRLAADVVDLAGSSSPLGATKKTERDGEAPAATTPKSAENLPTKQALLDEAAALEKKGAPAPTARGALGPPKIAVDVVDALSTDLYEIALMGEEIAIIRVSGDGDTDLDCFVTDENGNSIASDTDSTDECLIMFVPRWTGPFYLRVRNLGIVPNRYMVTTN